MIRDLKSDSARWRAEKAKNVPLDSSTTLDFEQDPWDIAEQCGWQPGITKFVWVGALKSQLTQIGKLGQWSMGTVYEVTSGKSQAARELSMVKTEVLTMKSLAHPNIVKVLGCFQDEEGTANHRFYVLMFPVGEKHLGTFIEDDCKGLQLDHLHVFSRWLKKWFHCLVSALAYMLSQNVHHCDIKPSNIVHRGEHIFFTDFSSSRQFEAGQSTSTESPARATKLYAAPETVRNNDGTFPRHGAKTDVFSLGLVFLEMIWVLSGGDIEDLRDRLFDTHQQAIQYHRVTETFLTNRIYLDYQDVAQKQTLYHLKSWIAPMLRQERQTRPAAFEVCKDLRNRVFFQSTLQRCQCMSLHFDSNTPPNLALK